MCYEPIHRAEMNSIILQSYRPTVETLGVEEGVVVVGCAMVKGQQALGVAVGCHASVFSPSPL